MENLGDWSWDTLDDQWKKFVNELQKYFEDNDTTWVRPSHETPNGYPLGKRVAKQRSLYKLGSLSAERIEFLEGLGDWSWEPRPDRWRLMFEKLQEYHTVNGTTWVPQRDKPLGPWVNSQRSAYKKGKLSAERIQLLESLGDWSWGTGRWPGSALLG